MRSGVNLQDIVQTAGEVLPGNRFLELVKDSADHDHISLLYRDGKHTKVGSRFKLDAKTFDAMEMDARNLQATRIPSTPVGECPTTRQLFSSLADTICSALSVAESQAWRFSSFCVSTWLADALPMAPPAFITGPDVLEGSRVLRVLHALCRRPILLTGASGGRWRSLSPLFNTLLIFRPELGPKSLHNLITSSNYPGIFVPATNGVHELYHPKALFVADATLQDDFFAGECLHVCLEGRSSYSVLKDRRIEEIAREFQPQLLAYRIANWAKVHNAETVAAGFYPAVRNIAAALVACTAGDQHTKDRIVALLAEEDTDARARQCTDPRVAIVEVLLDCVHAGEQKMLVKDLAAKMNALLRHWGELREYSEMELGWQLRALSIIPRRRAGGKMLFFQTEEIRRVHQLAKSLRVAEFHTGKQPCSWCKEGASA